MWHDSKEKKSIRMSSIDKKKTDLRKLAKDKVQKLKTRDGLEEAFSEFNIQNSDFLDKGDTRSLCFGCGKSRKYFCYNCHIPIEQFKDKIPRLEVCCSYCVLHTVFIVFSAISFSSLHIERVLDDIEHFLLIRPCSCANI